MKNILCYLMLIGWVTMAECLCYFNQEHQGVYVTQSVVGHSAPIHYLQLTVFPETVSVWGTCTKRLGNNFILGDSMGDTSCIRCYHFTQRTPHVLEVHTESLDKCYTTQEAAMKNCPTVERIRTRKALAMMLYKISNLSSNLPLPAVYCPINGRYSFTYDQNDGTETMSECMSPTSRVSNCPRGNIFSLQFKRCSFQDFEKVFECLGDWQGTDGIRYLALRDPSAHNGTGRPRFRCAMYSTDSETGKVDMALSSDSSCTNDLRTPRDGFENLAMHRINQPPPPITVSSRECTFPSFAQGQWEQVKVKDNELSFTDLQSFKTYKVFCLDGQAADSHTQLLPVFAQSHCGDEVFTCLSLKERSPNVLEFQMGATGLDVYKHNMCSLVNSQALGPWLTQGRVDRFRHSACPVAGEYTGALPDAPYLCAKLYSDCNNPEIMFYTVYSCANRSEVFEEREYRCLGQWSEQQTTFTYAQRRDVPGYECFAGVVENEGEIYIIEAGENCKRGLSVKNFGMKLKKQAACMSHPPQNWSPPTPRVPPKDRARLHHVVSSSTKSSISAVSLLLILFSLCV